ncbi:MAG: IclR family transcriptional regulator [Sporolactobacillus sp.]
MSQYEALTLKKGLTILDALWQDDSMTLSEVMHKLSMNKSTAFRLLYTLELMGYVKKNNNQYSVTNKMVGRVISFSAKLNWTTDLPLYELSSDVEETVYVGILQATNVVITRVVCGTCSLKTQSAVGESSPAHLSAIGKAIMAFLNTQSREDLVDQLQLIQNTKNSFIDAHLLKEHLKVIRQQGYAVDDEEREMSFRCLAVPIMYKGEVIAAVALSGPAKRLNKKLDKKLSKRLIRCSEQISQLLE